MSRLLLLALLTTTLCGCIVNPIYYVRDLLKLPGVEGVWESPQFGQEDDPFNSWEIAPADSNRYLIARNDGSYPRYYIAGFLKLGGILYLDMADFRHNERTRSEDLGTHNILRVYPGRDTLRARLMDLDYLTKCVRTKKYALKYENVTDRSSDYNTGTTTFITASTAELQAFLIAAAGDELLFPAHDSIVLYRADNSFNHYFPEESFDLQALQQRPETPAMLKAAFTRNWDRTSLNPLALIDSLTTAPLLYRPFYFRLAEFAAMDHRGEVDSMVAARFAAYVLANTREFLHYFNGGAGGGSATLQNWADIVSQQALPAPAQDSLIARMNTAGARWTAREQRMLAAFTKMLAAQYKMHEWQKGSRQGLFR